MTVSREDVESYLTAISTWKSLCVKYPATVPMNVELNVTTSLDALNGIEQVLEDRLNQVDYKSLAEEMYEALKSASTYISPNNPHWSAPYHNETTREIIEAISEWEKYGV